MRKFNLDGTIFEDEYGRLTTNAFEVLNHTYSPEYGKCKLFREAVDLVSENFDIIDDNMKDNIHYYNCEYVIEHFNKVTKMFYELLEKRKKINYKKKLDDINKDFE